MSELRLGIVGAGNIAKEHLKVIQTIEGLVVSGIVSRTRDKAEQLASEFGECQVYESPEDLIHKTEAQALLILVSADQIFPVVQNLCSLGVPMFLEKPPGLLPEQTRKLVECVENHGTLAMVGFNRRYYSVFHKGLELIRKHGELLGVAVEGHERFWRIKDRVSTTIREEWIYGNSTHTIDLLRFFGGELSELHAFSSSFLEKKGDQFSVTMSFKSGALGNYLSHWYSPGGWSVRLFGEGITVEFKPLEKGTWQDTSFKTFEIEPDEVDEKFKPGFYRQIEAFSRMVRTGKLEWPALDLRGAMKTMELAEKFAMI